MDKSSFVVEPSVIDPSFVRTDDRGLFVEIVNEGPWETIIHGSIKAGKVMGNHYHRENRAFFFLTRGKALVKIEHLVDGSSSSLELDGGKGVYFLPFEIHTIEYLEDSDFILMKSYRYSQDNPDIFPGEVD